MNIIIPEKEFDNRINICKTCEFFAQKSQRCRICGCFLLIKAKIKAASCPKQKWNDK